MLIRDEIPEDHQAIHELTDIAFAPMPYGDGTEAGSIDRMRADGDLTLSLVAVEDDRVIGHIAFSPLTVPGELPGWFGLGPISVTPERQRQGIGSAMAAEGLRRLKETGAAGVALIGRPAVYGPMGFVSDGSLSYRTLPPEIVQYVHFSGPKPEGELLFAPGLE